MTRRLTAVLLSALFAIIVAEPAKANAVEDFYKGKTINLYVGYPPGGGYDIYARLVARFIGRHIPGNPSLVVRNMPGAGSRTAASYVANVVPKDGLSLGAVHQALALGQAMGDKGIKFDTSKFNWIGSPDADNQVVVTWFTSGVKTIEDAKRREVSMGATANTPSSQYLIAMNLLIGTKFKVVFGYPGGNQINLAMERGEVAGRGSSSWATWKSKPELLRQHKINVLVQVGFRKAAELQDVPLLTDLGGSPDRRDALKMLSAPTAMGHPIFTSPGVPKERVDALRAAFDSTMKDPAFLAAAEQTQIAVLPTSGQDLQGIVAYILSASEPIKKRLAPIILQSK